MIKNYLIYSILLIAVLFGSCTPSLYIHDPDSYKRQKELCNSRSGNVAGDILVGFTAAFVGAMLDTEVEIFPADQEFKRINLVNVTSDTLYVNMLTDVYWDTNNYCDFMDIRIPPQLNCRVMVPMNAAYNIYYTSVNDGNHDNLLEIFTTDVKRIKLNPLYTMPIDSVISINN